MAIDDRCSRCYLPIVRHINQLIFQAAPIPMGFAVNDRFSLERAQRNMIISCWTPNQINFYFKQKQNTCKSHCIVVRIAMQNDCKQTCSGHDTCWRSLVGKRRTKRNWICDTFAGYMLKWKWLRPADYPKNFTDFNTCRLNSHACTDSKPFPHVSKW